MLEFCTKKRKEKGTTLTQFLRTLCLLMAYLNNVEHIVFIALFENACGDLKKKKKKTDLNVFLIQKQRRIHSTFANIHIHRISLILNAWLKRDAKLKVIFWSSKQSLH
jgi:hypothetical protein